MNTRIKEIRKSVHLTQDEFAEKIGLSKNFVWMMENGERIPSDRTIADICRIFSINETWLRSGEGEMKLELTKNQEIAQFLNEVMAEDDEDFKKNFIEALARLNDNEWQAFASITRKIVDDFIKDNNESSKKG